MKGQKMNNDDIIKDEGHELNLYVVGSHDAKPQPIHDAKPHLIVHAYSREEALRIASEAWIGRTFTYARKIEPEGVQMVLGMFIEL